MLSLGFVKSYGQYCALARGLDVVGDRWTLLIVRELLIGPRRYADLLEGLPGIATNLLAERLRHLEQHAVVERNAQGLYQLTEWGQGLAEPLYGFARWAAPLMAEPVGDDAFRSAWLAHPVAAIFDGVDPRRPDMTVEVHTGESPVTIVSTGGAVRVRPGPADAPNLVISGPPDAVVGLLAGALDKAGATRRGLTVQGDVRSLARLRNPGRSPSTRLPAHTSASRQ